MGQSYGQDHQWEYDVMVKTTQDAINDVMEAWKTDDDLKESAKACPGAFCVIVLVENYYPESGKTYFKYDNYRVVVGPKDNIDKLKTTFADKMKGTFNAIIREQAI